MPTINIIFKYSFYFYRSKFFILIFKNKHLAFCNCSRP